MSVLYRNRLTGAEAPAPGLPSLFGLWQVVLKGEDTVFLNSVPLASGDFLVPDASGHWSLLGGEEGSSRSGSFGKYQVPETLEAHSVRTLGEKLQGLLEAAKGWLEWSIELPVLPEMSARVEVQRLEQAIAKHFGHLKQVCHRPRAHLRVDIERSPVSRARRIPPQAANFLAAHSEDWERPTLRAVHPKRILSLVRDDLVDIYENRVTARLVDHLLTYIRGRIHEVRKLRRVFDRTKNYEEQALAGSHWRQKRVCGLWGRAVDLDERRRRADDTLRVLDQLQHDLLGLMNTALYKGVPRRARVGDTLSLTNILLNDTHYRHVATLWREWFEHGRIRVQSPREVYGHHQLLCRGFDLFCMLLVIRALDQLGYTPADLEAPIRRGAEFELDGRGERIRLRWEVGGVITLHTDLGEHLRIVPLPAVLSASPDDGAAWQHIHALTPADPAKGASSLLVLHPTSSDEEGEQLGTEVCQRLHTLENELKETERGGPAMLPVAPWDIGSVERVARALRWVLSAPRILRYPPLVESPQPESLSPPTAVGWLQQDGGKFKVVRLPNAYERKLFDTATLVRQAESHVDELQLQHQHHTEAAHEASRKGARTGALNAQKSDSNAALSRARVARDRARSFHTALEEALHGVERLLSCPTCGDPVDPQHGFQPSSDGHFHCVCSNCDTQWGTRACGICRGRFPILLPCTNGWAGTEPDPGWVDRVLGADVLAVPCARSLKPDTFICSNCGRCSCSACQHAADARTSAAFS